MENDVDQWNKKFAPSVKDRQAFKKKFQPLRNFSVMTSNSNIATSYDADARLQAINYTGGLTLPESSEFKRVLKKRKSRLSTLAPSVLDLDCKGAESNAMKHLFGRSNTV